MSSGEKEEKRISRRDFVRGAAVGAAGVAAASVLAGCANEATPEVIKETVEVPVEVIKEVESKPWLPEKWDYEADVVVIGTGFAGQATAIEADKLGASVLMLEKAPEEFQGGNSRVSGQGFIAPSPAIWDDYFTYLKYATAGQGFPIFPDETLSDQALKFYIEESYKSLKWFEDLGITVLSEEDINPGATSFFPFFPHFPGAEGVATEPGYYTVGGEYLGPGRNWYALEDYILERRGIEKMYETPAKRLIQDPITKEILGVVAESGGKEIYVKAKRAVCVCAGGFEYSQQMQRDFQGIPVNYSPGSPYNTGETIKMCWEAGADIRNMGVRNAPVFPTRYSAGIKPPWKSAIGVSSTLSGGASYIPGKEIGGVITVGANNKRWCNEYVGLLSFGGIHNREKSGQEGAVIFNGHVVENGVYVREKYPMPMHMIFDEQARLAGPLFNGSFVTQVEGYECSADNSAELEAGWIIKADTIKELAQKIGQEPDPLFGRVPLEETINRWNEFCAAGKDLDYGRTSNLTPITGGPFYAIELFPICVNTQGGMKRNTKAQVIDIRGEPIPRLYSAGENGEIWTYVYQCMSNVGGGCYGYGRVAGQNAAAEEPWA